MHDSAPTPKEIAYYRHKALARCLKYRSGETIPADHREIAQQFLKREQLGLLKLRVWRSTGVYPREN